MWGEKLQPLYFVFLFNAPVVLQSYGLIGSSNAHLHHCLPLSSLRLSRDHQRLQLQQRGLSPPLSAQTRQPKDLCLHHRLLPISRWHPLWTVWIFCNCLYPQVHPWLPHKQLWPLWGYGACWWMYVCLILFCIMIFHPVIVITTAYWLYTKFFVSTSRIFLFAFAASYSMRGKLDLHIASGFVYFSDNSTSTSYRGIFRVNTDGGYYSRVINSGIGRGGIQGLAVDWIAGMKPPTHPFFHPLPLQGGSRSKDIKGRDHPKIKILSLFPRPMPTKSWVKCLQKISVASKQTSIVLNNWRNSRLV